MKNKLVLTVGCRGQYQDTCDLCYAKQESAKSELGKFKICRTLEERKQIADLLHFNPNKLTQAQLSAVAKKVKTHPLLNIEHAEQKRFMRPKK